MTRIQLEHLIRAAGAITGSREIIIIGSQAILGSFPNAPETLLVSNEADLFPADDAAKADLVDGSIGELSPFHGTFGYYAHGVGPETATLPGGWQNRLVRIINENTMGITGLCLHPADLAISKLAAGREKDLLFVKDMIRSKIITTDELTRLLPELPAAERKAIQDRITLLDKGLYRKT